MARSPLFLLRDRGMQRHILRLAWPTITETALQTVVQYVDTAQVGQLGAAASAAVGLSATTTWLVNAPLWAVSTGILACISQARGAEDRERMIKAAGQAKLLVWILGVVMTVLTLSISPHLPDWLGAETAIRRDAALYFGIICAPMLFRVSGIIFSAVLRAAGDTKTPMWIHLGMNLMNIVLNTLLIMPTREISFFGIGLRLWGAGLGVPGAAIATASSFVFGGIGMFLAAWRVEECRSARAVYDRAAMRACLSIGMPLAAERMISMFGQVVFTALIARLGMVAVAAHSIAITAEQAFYVPGYGMQTAASTLAGFHYGAGDEKRLTDYSASLLLLAVILMSALSLFLFLFPAFFMRIFTPDEDVIALGARVLRIVSVSEPFFAVVIILEGVFSGVGDVRAPLLFSLFSMWGVRLCLTALCVFRLGLGLEAVWCCMVADNLTRFFLLFSRFCGRRWKRGLPIASNNL